MSTIIAAGITVEGEIVADEDLQIGGTVRGKLTSKDVVAIEAGAVVEADVQAASLTIGGNLVGNSHVTERVDLLAGARVIGNVKAARITIAEGAQFKGNVDMDV